MGFTLPIGLVPKTYKGAEAVDATTVRASSTSPTWRSRRSPAGSHPKGSSAFPPVPPERRHVRVRPQADPRLLDAAVQALDPVLTRV